MTEGFTKLKLKLKEMKNSNVYWIKVAAAFYMLLFIVALSLCCTLFANAQVDTLFVISDVENVVLKPQTEHNGIVAKLEVTRMPYSVKQTESGQYYLNYTDTSGKLRRKYLGWLPEQREHSVTIFCNRLQTKFWYWQFGQESLPTKIFLPETVIDMI